MVHSNQSMSNLWFLLSSVSMPPMPEALIHIHAITHTGAHKKKTVLKSYIPAADDHKRKKKKKFVTHKTHCNILFIFSGMRDSWTHLNIVVLLELVRVMPSFRISSFFFIFAHIFSHFSYQSHTSIATHIAAQLNPTLFFHPLHHPACTRYSMACNTHLCLAFVLLFILNLT